MEVKTLMTFSRERGGISGSILLLELLDGYRHVWDNSLDRYVVSV